VYDIFRKYDLLFVPTKGENFGHIFIEALEAGCPILTSDQTPWSWVKTFNAGGAIDLEKDQQYIKFIENFSSKKIRLHHHINALDAYQKFINENDSIAQTKSLFGRVTQLTR
jgi:glycosyltransferase involved in cell wall biosynthesis